MYLSVCNLSVSQVYCVPIGGMLVRQPLSVGGSGSTYIYGFMDSNYKPGMSKDQCLELTATGTAAARHAGSWGPLPPPPTVIFTQVLLRLTCMSVSQLCLWRWRETDPAGVWSDWRASQRRAWRDVSSWEISCHDSLHTEHTHTHAHLVTMLC